MTEHLYYHDSFLYEFEAEVTGIVPPQNAESRPALVLDRTAFYPTSGGQVFDTGWITTGADAKLRITEVVDSEDGKVVHYLEKVGDLKLGELKPGARVRGQIDAVRRRDHMQQHSG